MKLNKAESKLEISYGPLILAATCFVSCLMSLITYAVFHITLGEEKPLFSIGVGVSSGGTFLFVLFSIEYLIFVVMKFLKAIKQGESLAEEGDK